jgi:RNA recognition motif-containing protein
MKGYKLMGRKLYVGNLSFNTTDQMLQETFSPYGEVTSATVIMDRDTNRSKGFGFVEFAQDADAQSAKGAMDGKELDGRSLRVDEAKEPREREQRSGSSSFRRSSRF